MTRASHIMMPLSGFLWLLWLITGVDAADSTSHSFPNGCEGFVNGLDCLVSYMQDRLTAAQVRLASLAVIRLVSW